MRQNSSSSLCVFKLRGRQCLGQLWVEVGSDGRGEASRLGEPQGAQRTRPNVGTMCQWRQGVARAGLLDKPSPEPGMEVGVCRLVAEKSWKWSQMGSTRESPKGGKIQPQTARPPAMSGSTQQTRLTCLRGWPSQPPRSPPDPCPLLGKPFLPACLRDVCPLLSAPWPAPGSHSRLPARL